MPSSLAANFARTLRETRTRQGLTQADLAEKIGLAVEAYGRLERGRVLPRTSTLVALSRALGLTCDQLLALDETGNVPLAKEGAAEYGAGNNELRRLIQKLRRVPPRHLRLMIQLASALARAH